METLCRPTALTLVRSHLSSRAFLTQLLRSCLDRLLILAVPLHPTPPPWTALAISVKPPERVLMPAYVTHERGVVRRDLGHRAHVPARLAEVEVAQPEAAEGPEHLQGDAEGFALQGEEPRLMAEVDGSGAEAYTKMDEKEARCLPRGARHQARRVRLRLSAMPKPASRWAGTPTRFPRRTTTPPTCSTTCSQAMRRPAKTPAKHPQRAWRRKMKKCLHFVSSRNNPRRKESRPAA